VPATLQIDHEVLRPPPDGLDALAAQTTPEARDIRLCDAARPGHDHLFDASPEQLRAQLAHDRLDLGKLWHRGVLARRAAQRQGCAFARVRGVNSRPAAPDAYDAALARHYDQDYEILRRDAGDVRFYRELARACGSPVLEVGCGTGRVLLPIARDGLQVTGVDPSTPMLAQLEHKLAQEPAAVRARVRTLGGRFDELPVNGPFSLVFAAFRAFQHVHGREAQLTALRELARVLAPDGTLAFDAFDYSPQRASPPEDERCDYQLDQGGVLWERLSSARLSPDGRTLVGRFRWLRDGTEIDCAPFQLEIVRCEELLGLLSEAGLQLEALHADFEGAPWDEGDPRDIIVLARRGAATSGTCT